MRTGNRVVLALLAIAALMPAADNTVGTWKMNPEKSKQAAGVSPIRSLTVVREASETGIKSTVKGERADGTKIESAYTAKYDGQGVPVTGTGIPWDLIAMKQVDTNTATEERTKKGESYHTNVRDVVSKDGKTMTVTSKGTGSDGKALNSKIVFQKQ